MPSKADAIRAHALERHVLPWLHSGEKCLSIRAGDVVRGMRLHNATPNVCSALASRRFQLEAGIVLVAREGPPQSTKTTFYYESGSTTPEPSPRRENASEIRRPYRQPRVDRPSSRSGDQWRTAGLCLVSCVSPTSPTGHLKRW